MEAVFVRAPYNYDMDAVSFETGLACMDPSLAVQSSKEECDINTIVKRFGLTGRLPENVRVPTYADFDDVMDFQSAQNALVAARESFMEMPPAIRSRFDNDPGRFVEFCSNDKNLEEMRSMGLAVKPSEPPVPVVPPSGSVEVKPAGESPQASSGSTVVT